eukprot:tig00020592_g11645.t1
MRARKLAQRRQHARAYGLLLAALCCLLGARAQAPTASPSPTATPTAVATPSPTPSPTFSAAPAPTAAPTASPAPAAPTALPTPVPAAFRPNWLAQLERETGVALTFTLSPAFGPLTGRDRVTVTASLPVFSGFPRCFFGSLDSPGMIVGKTNLSITVVTLPSPARTADLLLYLDDTAVTGLPDSSVVTVPRAYKFNARPVAAVANRTIIMFFPSLPFVVDGSLSNDTDGYIARWNWTQTLGLPAAMVDRDGPRLGVTLPNTPGTYGFQLVVTDENGYVDSTNVAISLFFARALRFSIATSATGAALRAPNAATGRPLVEDVLRAAAGVLLSPFSAMSRVRLNGEGRCGGGGSGGHTLARPASADAAAAPSPSPSPAPAPAPAGRRLLQAGPTPPPPPSPSPTPGALPAGAASLITFVLAPPPGARAETFLASLTAHHANRTGSLAAAMSLALPVPLVSLSSQFLDRSENTPPVVHFASASPKRVAYAAPATKNDSRGFFVSVDASPSTDVDGYIRVWGWGGTLTRNASLLGPGLTPPPGPDGTQTIPLDLSDPEFNTPRLVIRNAFPDGVYNLVLVATDNDGGSSAPRYFTVEVTRPRLGPVASVAPPDECLVYPNDAVTLRAAASHTGPFPQALAYRWEHVWAVGGPGGAPALPPAGTKGAPPAPRLSGADNATVRASGLYPGSGHRLVLTVTDLDGLSARVSAPVCVLKNPKTARIEALVPAAAACVAAVVRTAPPRPGAPAPAPASSSSKRREQLGLLALGTLGAAVASALGDVVVSTRRGNLLGLLHHAQLAAMYGELALAPDIFAILPSAIGFVTGQFRPPWLAGASYGPYVQNTEFGWVTRWHQDPWSEAWSVLQGSAFYVAAAAVGAGLAHAAVHAFAARVLKMDRPPDRVVFPRLFLALALAAQGPLCLAAAKNLRSVVPYAAALGALLAAAAGAAFPALCAWRLRRLLAAGSVRYRSYQPPRLLHAGFRAYRRYLVDPVKKRRREREIELAERTRRPPRGGRRRPRLPGPAGRPEPPAKRARGSGEGEGRGRGPSVAGLALLEARREGGAVVAGPVALPPLDTVLAQQLKQAEAEKEAAARAKALRAVRATLHQRKAFLRAAEARGAASDFAGALAQAAGRVLRAPEAFWYLEAGAWLRTVLWRCARRLELIN